MTKVAVAAACLSLILGAWSMHADQQDYHLKIGDDVIHNNFQSTIWIACKGSPCFNGSVTFFKGKEPIKGPLLPKGAGAVHCGDLKTPVDILDGCETKQVGGVAGCGCKVFHRERTKKNDGIWTDGTELVAGHEYRCFCLRPANDTEAKDARKAAEKEEKARKAAEEKERKRVKKHE